MPTCPWGACDDVPELRAICHGDDDDVWVSFACWRINGEWQVCGVKPVLDGVEVCVLAEAVPDALLAAHGLLLAPAERFEIHFARKERIAEKVGGEPGQSAYRAIICPA